ncbi:MAG: hypothetical protein ACC619_00955 [Paracoccaceae bacterium]
MSRNPSDFPARDPHRLRRAMDAARLLPIVGAFLFLLPLLWAGGMTSSGIIYIFGIWIVLIGIAGLLSRPLSKPPADRPLRPDEGR